MIETVTKNDLKATPSMILKKEFPTAKYNFVNDALVWEDKEITKPTDEWIANKIKEHDDKL
tara:strand:+ start:543 stop:725 length:183 start_codon:yes stop_codon:yes gene_type:complete